jgi:hypothetical protein
MQISAGRNHDAKLVHAAARRIMNMMKNYPT